MISSSKWQRLRETMQRMEISEHDLNEKFILSPGRGGQKVQKSASCVYLKHLPLRHGS